MTAGWSVPVGEDSVDPSAACLRGPIGCPIDADGISVPLRCYGHYRRGRTTKCKRPNRRHKLPASEHRKLQGGGLPDLSARHHGPPLPGPPAHTVPPPTDV